jgi:hypothetical protein
MSRIKVVGRAFMKKTVSLACTGNGTDAAGRLVTRSMQSWYPWVQATP